MFIIYILFKIYLTKKKKKFLKIVFIFIVNKIFITTIYSLKIFYYIKDT